MSEFGLLDSLNLTPSEEPGQQKSEKKNKNKAPAQIIRMSETQLRWLIVGVAGVSILLTALVFMFTSFGDKVSFNNGSNKINGQVALTEEQLFTLVKENGVTAYWSGPQPNAMYALTITPDKQVYVKYLPDGKGLGDPNLNYRVIASYPEPGAYDITRAAGTQANSVAFVNSDGAAVYYSKDKPTNVYVAFSGEPYEIEIFDPDPNTALNLGTQTGAILQIK